MGWPLVTEGVRKKMPGAAGYAPLAERLDTASELVFTFNFF
jgi:hypothetical protein